MIRSLRVENLFQHRGVEVELGPGVTVVVGGNGSGKSNLLAALRYAVGGNPAAVRGASAEGSSPSTTLVLSPPGAGDEVATLIRRPGASHNARRLEFRGNRVTSAEAVRGLLEEWWGCDPAAAFDAAFCPQGRLTDLADASPGDRRKDDASFLGLDAAEDAWQAMSEVTTPPGDPPDVDAAALRLSDAERSLAGAETRLASLPADAAAAVRAASDALAAALAADSEAHARRTASARLQDVLAERVSVETTVARCDADRPALAATAAWVGPAAAALKAWEDWTAYEADLAAVAAAEADAAAKAALVPPPPPQEQSDAALEAMRSEIGTQRRLAALTPGQPCPTCGVTTASPQVVAAARIVVAAFDDLEWKARSAASSRNQLAKAWQKASNDSFLAARHADTLRARLRPQPPHPPAPLQQARDALRSGNAAAANLSMLDLTRAASERRLAELAVEEARLRPLTQRTVATADVAACRAALDAANAAAAAKAQAESVVTYARSERDRAKSELARATAARAEWRAAADWYVVAKAARDQLHRDAAPARAAAGHTRATAAAAAAWLDALSAGYTLVPSGDWYDAGFPDGGTWPTARLSGAQKLLLGLAWRLARLEVGASRFGLLVLDEPTYGLDAARMAALASALDVWRSRSAGRQILLVTHDPRLADAADRVVHL